MAKIMFGLFVSGLLFGAGPCIASCGPVVISYIAGTGKNMLGGLRVYFLFSLARIWAYITLSLLIFFLGSFTFERLLGGYSKYVAVILGCFMILVGALITIGKKTGIKTLCILQKKLLVQDNKSIIYLGFAMGIIPCLPLVTVLTYLGLVAKSWEQGLFYSISFGIGTLISPLILLAISAALIPQFLVGKKAVYSQILGFICGFIIIFLGIQFMRTGL